MAMNKILVAVDGSENGERAARTAISFAKDYSAQSDVLLRSSDALLRPANELPGLETQNPQFSENV